MKHHTEILKHIAALGIVPPPGSDKVQAEFDAVAD